MTVWLVIAAIIIMYIVMKETFTTRTAIDISPGESKEVVFGTITIPAHNSGKTSMWLPAGINPSYESRELIVTSAGQSPALVI